MQTQGRIEWIDYLRGFLMLAVIAGHCGLTHYIPYSSVVNQCHMATYFFLSGYTYRERGELFSSYCAKRAKRLLIPYAVYGVAFVAADTAFLTLKGLINMTTLLKKWGGLIYCRYMLRASLYTSGGGVHFLTSWNSTVWFLTAMFLAGMLFFALVHLRGKRLFVAVLACLAVSGAFTYCPILLPWSLDTAPLCALLMLSGFYVRKLNLTAMRLPRKIALLAPAAAVYLLSLTLGDAINLSIRIYGARGLVSFAWALPTLFAGSLCFTLVFSMIAPARLLCPLASVGRHSITYLCIHLFALFIASRLLSFFALPELTSTVLRFLFALAAGALSCLILDKLKGRFAIFKYL